MFMTQSFPGNHLFTIETSTAITGNPSWANLKFRAFQQQTPQDFNGPGLYMIFFDGAPVYLGKFLGQKNNLFGSNVLKMRWDKHLGTLTYRGKSLSVNKGALEGILTFLGEIQNLDQWGRELRNGHLATNTETLTRDRGCVSSLNRFRFAAENWQTFTVLQTADLARFSFLYVRIAADQFGQYTNETEKKIRLAVSRAEKRLISELCPRANREIVYGAHRCDYTEDHARNIIEAAIQAELTRLIANEPIHFQNPGVEGILIPAPNVNPPEPIEVVNFVGVVDRPESAQDLFIESIGESLEAMTLINDLTTLCDELDAEMHFTLTNGGDLRVRCDSPVHGRPGKNILAMYWQRRLRRFSCEVFLPLNECIGLDDDKRQVNHVDKKLPTLIKIEPGVDDQVFLRIISDSIHRFRDI